MSHPEIGYSDPETQQLLDKIAGFLREIGIEVTFQSIDEQTFLPGIKVDACSLVVDKDQLKYPGDLLHEAGHLAVITAEERMSGEVGKKANHEILAIAWSYAAALHLDLNPAIVIHSGGYHGWREAFLATLSRGSFIGVRGLEELGLTADPAQAAQLGIAPFPHMTRWMV